jgi:hypothetical protein
VARLVENELGIGTPGGEQPVLEAGPAHSLEILGWNDLVGVDIAAA